MLVVFRLFYLPDTLDGRTHLRYVLVSAVFRLATKTPPLASVGPGPSDGEALPGGVLGHCDCENEWAI